jgi:hypothetical protein
MQLVKQYVALVVVWLVRWPLGPKVAVQNPAKAMDI